MLANPCDFHYGFAMIPVTEADNQWIAHAGRRELRINARSADEAIGMATRFALLSTDFPCELTLAHPLDVLPWEERQGVVVAPPDGGAFLATVAKIWVSSSLDPMLRLGLRSFLTDLHFTSNMPHSTNPDSDAEWWGAVLDEEPEYWRRKAFSLQERRALQELTFDLAPGLSGPHFKL